MTIINTVHSKTTFGVFTAESKLKTSIILTIIFDPSIYRPKNSTLKINLI